MLFVRRNAGWFGIASASLCALLVAAWLLTPSPSSAAKMAAVNMAAFVFDEPYTPLDAVTAARIERLRNDAGLDDDVLAATDASAEQLEDVLAAIRTWYDSNVGTWTGQLSSIADKQAEIRDILSQIDVGSEDVETLATQLATARSELATLEAAYATLLGGLRTSALAELLEGQHALADVMYANKGVAMPYRMLNLDATEESGALAAETDCAEQLAVAEDDAAREAILSDFDDQIISAIGNDNVQQLAAIEEYRGAASVRVVDAVKTVLPVQ